MIIQFSTVALHNLTIQDNMLQYLGYGQSLTHWDQMTHICADKLTIIGSDNCFVDRPVPNHYLNQCWNIVNWTLGNKHQGNINRNSYIYIHENAFGSVWKMAAILSRPKCVNDRVIVVGNTKQYRTVVGLQTEYIDRDNTVDNTGQQTIPFQICCLLPVYIVSIEHSILSAFPILYFQSSTFHIVSLPHPILATFHIAHLPHYIVSAFTFHIDMFPHSILSAFHILYCQPSTLLTFHIPYRLPSTFHNVNHTHSILPVFPIPRLPHSICPACHIRDITFHELFCIVIAVIRFLHIPFMFQVISSSTFQIAPFMIHILHILNVA